MYKQIKKKKKKIGILGSGDVAKSLGYGFLKYGYSVMLGTRTASKLDDWKKIAGDKALVGTFADAAAYGEIIVLATKATYAKNSIKMACIENMAGKTVIDATNPIADLAPENGVLRFFTNLDKSFMEDLQTTFSTVKFVKAFNSIGSPFMVNPDFGGIKPSMCICGNDENSKSEVKTIVDLFGFEAEDMGGAEAARAIEPLCMLWCIPGLRENKWAHAFKLLKKIGKKSL